MAKRKRIGIIFGASESWAGGFYYVLNLIKSLNYLPEPEKPELVVFCDEQENVGKIRAISYPFVSFIRLSKTATKWELRFYNFFRKLGGKKMTPPWVYPTDTAEIVFPNSYQSEFSSLAVLERAYWIPDFQHKFFPQNFSSKELVSREECTQRLIENNYRLILSSKSAESDFKRFYPNAQNHVFVLPFCSLLSDYHPVDIRGKLEECSVGGKYFISPNQFWKHKNHIVVLKAAKLLKDKGVFLKILFTGNEAGNEEYVNGLKNYIAENGLDDVVCFLGFLDRDVQLSLVQQAHAVIQPSLFEGWSTVVEDAKALGKYVIASSLDVHKEQLISGASFFDPYNEQELALLLEDSWFNDMRFSVIDYQQHIVDFARKVASIT